YKRRMPDMRVLYMSGIHPGGKNYKRGMSLELEFSRPVINLAVGIFFSDAVFFLNHTGQLFAATFDHINVIIRQVAPFFTDFAFKLFPSTLNLIPRWISHSYPFLLTKFCRCGCGTCVPPPT